MKKNYNYAYVNRTSRPKPHIDFTNMERADCTASVLKSSPVANDRLWHTTDTNEFYFDWNGKRSKLNVTGDNAAMAAEIAKIKADMANLNPDEVGKKIKTLETKVNNAAKNAQNAQTAAQTAAQAAQTAANQVSKKADKTYVDNNFAKKSDIPDISGKANKSYVDNNFVKKTDITGYATEQWVEGKGYLTSADIPEIPDLSEYATKQDLNNLDLFSGDYNDLSNKPELFSGSYNDLTDKPTIPEIPENVSAFTNDAGYLTEHQDISGKADKTDLNGLASQEWVSEQGYLTAQNISGKADITYVDETFAAKDDIPEVPENVSAFNNDAGYLTEVEVGTFPSGESIEEPTTDADGYAKVQDIMDYVNALIEKKKDELTPGGDSADYIYVSGVRMASVSDNPQPEPIYQMNCFEIDNDVLTNGIMVVAGPEINGFYDGDDSPTTTYAQLFSVDVPSGYTIEVHGWNEQGTDEDHWYHTVQPMSPNPRYTTKQYGGKTYNCYVRTEEDFYGEGVAKPADKYLIIINKN